MRAKLGQNFLKSRDIAKRIVDLLELKENEKVLEIGGGKGILTQFLLKKGANVFVVEIDKKLVQYLKERFKGSKNLEIINCDILKPNKRLKEIFSSKNFKVIGNIPFNITSRILEILLTNDFFDIAVLTVQKEVAKRILSSGGRSFGRLTVQIKTFFSVKKGFDIKRKFFYPIPEVDATVVILKKKRKYFEGEKRKLWEEFLMIVFPKKRKYIKNSLSCFLKDKTEEILRNLSLSPDLRPEDIPYFKYEELFDIIFN